MQKGSLVRIKKSGDKRLIGTFGIVLGFSFHDHILIKRFDGRKDSYNKTRLELIA